MSCGFIYTGKWYIDNNIAYACSHEYPGIFSIDLRDNRCRFLGFFPVEFRKQYSYSTCFKCCGKIVCLPTYNSNNILIYDLDKGMYTCLELSEIQKDIHMWGYALEDRKAYIISMGLNQIIELDIENEVIVNKYNIPVNSGSAINSNIVKMGNYIYIMEDSGKCCFDFDMCNKNISKIFLEDIVDGVKSFCSIGEYILILNERYELSLWNTNTNEIKNYIPDFLRLADTAIIIEDNIFKKDIRYFSDLIPVEGFVFMIPYCGNVVPVFCMDKREYIYMELPHSEHRKSNTKNYFPFYSYENIVGIYDIMDGVIYEIDVKTMKVINREIEFDESMSELCTSMILEEANAGHRALAQAFTPLILW